MSNNDASSRVARDRIRVVHVVKGLGPGGAERLIVNQALTRDIEVFDYRVLRLIAAKDHLVPDLERAGVPVDLVGSGPTWPVALARKLRDIAPDVVHVHSPVVAAVVRILSAARLLRGAIVTTEHNRWPRHHRLTRLANRATARFDDARLAVSEDVRTSMATAARAGTRVLHHGVDTQAVSASKAGRNEVRAELDLSDEVFAVGIVANFRPEKAHGVFLRAAVHALSSRPDLRFVVVGQGPGEEKFRKDVAAAGVDESVLVLGYRPDATAVMAAFDVFCLSSRHEGLPVAIMEALSLGLPIVSTRAGGVGEAVEHNVNGLLVDIDDAPALAEAWLALAGDPTRRSAMAQAAKESASKFDAASSTSEIESTYRSLVASTSRTGSTD
ncbi:MAG: glycosyltransferase [Acidimicrobiales bacterium]